MFGQRLDNSAGRSSPAFYSSSGTTVSLRTNAYGRYLRSCYLRRSAPQTLQSQRPHDLYQSNAAWLTMSSMM
eukprot:4748556-Amphidinium_carterae.1